jgi:hypothetical protein
MKRLPAILLALALLLFAGAYFGSPALALYQLKEAARAHDTDRLEALIDFPAVRENLKRQLDSEVAKAARAAENGGWAPLEIIGRLGALWGDRKIRKMVEPGGLEQMLANGELRPAFSYLTLDRVRVTLKRPGERDLPIALIMDRRGLFGWQVVKIELPGEGD